MTEDKNNTDNLINCIIKGIEDVKGEEITLLDLKEIDNTVCDYFIICEGNSNTQINAIANSVEKTVKETADERPWHIEGIENGQWVLMDYVHVVVHIFQKPVREYYDIESLWGDAKTVTLGGN